jgi:RNA polymerase sigma-70 factor (ECF subfamily)
MEDRPAEDSRLVEAVLGGDGRAFGTLIGRYQGLVAGVAWRFGIRREEIEDVVSEVFTKVYRNLHQYRPDHPFPTWLYRLAANHVVDHARRARKERGREELPDQVTDTSPGPREGFETRERASLLRGAMEEIDARYREVIFLVYVEELKVEEAARLLGLPEGTVKTRLMRGRDALRKILTRRHPGYFGGRDAVS